MRLQINFNCEHETLVIKEVLKGKIGNFNMAKVGIKFAH